MAISNSKKGSYYKLRTKKWLEEKGYQVGFLERIHWLFKAGQRSIPIKKDQFGSDLLAVNKEQVIFVQVKLNRKNIADARKEFSKYKFPDFADVWIVVWEPRAREPEIIEYSEQLGLEI